uniref:Uncharacterized protein n=1 Tax=Zea mays TaxID=4577 RepID=C4J1X6_MAIZE|nr:unknown [Zea mays]
MEEISGILGALFSLQKLAGSPLWPTWEELHYPAKHPFNNLVSFIRIHCCLVDGACVNWFRQGILVSHPLRSQ